MFTFSVLARHPLRVLGTVTALLMGTTLAGQRAEALSPLSAASAGVSKAPADGLTIEVRGGHGGGGGGGGGRGGGIGGFGAGRGAGPGFSGAFVRGGAIGPAPAVVAGAPAFAGHIAGGPRFAGRPFFHHHRHFGGVFVGGVYYDDYPYDYPDEYYDYPPVYSVPVPAFVAGGGCRRVMTVHGPRVFCHHRVARHHHRIHRRHVHRRHHRA